MNYNNVNRTKINDFKYKIFYIFIIVIQILVSLYWLNNKTNYSIDEYYSFGYASNFLGTEDTSIYITTSEAFKMNSWTDNNDLKKQLLVSDAESVLNLSFSDKIKTFFGKRNYFFILNLAESLYNYDGITKRPAFMVNVLIMIISEILLIILLRKMGLNRLLIGLCLAMYGLSAFAIGLELYVRFYCLVSMFAVAVLLLHYIMFTTEKKHIFIISQVVVYILLYLMLKNSEVTALFGAALVVAYSMGLFIKKKKWKFYLYVTLPLLGLIILLNNSKYINMIVFYASKLYRDDRFFVEFNTFKTSFLYTFGYIVKYFFNSGVASAIWILFISIIVFNLKKNIYINKVHIWVMTVWGAIVFFFCNIDIQPGYELLNDSKNIENSARIMIVILFVLISGYILFPSIKIFISNCKGYSDSKIFFYIILVTFLLLTLFMANTGILLSRTPRYNTYCFDCFIVVFWFAVDRILKRSHINNNILLCIVGILVFISGLMPFITRQVEYVYEGDKDLCDVMIEYNTLDVVNIAAVNNEGTVVATDSIYDCVSKMSNTSKIYPMDYYNYQYDDGMFPDECILWTHNSFDIIDIIQELKDDGYEIKNIGFSHCSQVYYLYR